MSEENRDSEGRFSSAEPVFGRAALERDAGFSPLTPPPKDEPEFTTAAEVADAVTNDELADELTKAVPEIVPIDYMDADGQPVGPWKTVTLEQAASDLAAFRGAQGESRGKDISSDFAAAIDQMRADAVKGDPKLAEHYGVELPGAQGKGAADAAPAAKNNTEDVAFSDDGLDPKLEEVLKHPQIREAIELQIAEADKARQSYVDALDATSQYAHLAFVDQFPEFISLPPAQWPAMLEAMSVQDPAKFARVSAAVSRSEQLRVHQQHAQQRQAETTRREFADFAKAEDARFDAMVPKVSREVFSEILAGINEAGFEPAEFAKMANSDRTLRHAHFQSMMHDAAKYRLLMKTAKAVPARAALPHVTRPGASQPAVDRGARNIADLNKLFASSSGNKQMRAAADLLHARRAKNER